MAKTNWGNWTFNTNNACLEYQHVNGSGPYQVPVDEMTTSAAILDWIFQLEEKKWVTSADLGDLVAAIADLVGRDVAGSGIDHPIDPKKRLSARFGVTFS